ncbi:MAG: glycoside hydrolase family 66 protein [Lachnospiraceae bacterium]|jgi:dextranase|nr:glycoside hydrolase family 66 protein [Lachnospiraceae bacterium]
MNMKYDLFPQRAQYRSGEPVTLLLEAQGASEAEEYCVTVYRDRKEVQCVKGFTTGMETVVELGVYQERLQGFGVKAVVAGERLYTAFDVVDSSQNTFRYGFVSDFAVTDEQKIEDITGLNKLHMTHVQFYDWMYRHEELVPPTDHFTDLMGRALSKKAVQEKIKRCHAHGMKAIAYGAVYAASWPFYERHPDWALCSGTGKAYDFIGKLKIMSMAKDIPWRAHITGQYLNAVNALSFDGIHIDTYGCPKWGKTDYNGEEREEYLQDEFGGFVSELRADFEAEGIDPTLVFNHVGNWPVKDTAGSPLDATYIEVWEPYSRLADLGNIIEEALVFAPQRPVVLAAYIRPYLTGPVEEAQWAALLVMAAVVSHGGYHLALGGYDAILTQAYYVDYTKMNPEFVTLIRRYCDYMVQHSHIFYDRSLINVSKTHMSGDNYEYKITGAEVSAFGIAGRLYVIARESRQRKVISLLNLYGNDDRWDTPKKQPTPVGPIELEIAVLREPGRVFSIAPNENEGFAVPVAYSLAEREQGLFLSCRLEAVTLWSTVVLEFDDEQERRSDA